MRGCGRKWEVGRKKCGDGQGLLTSKIGGIGGREVNSQNWWEVGVWPQKEVGLKLVHLPCIPLSYLLAFYHPMHK